MAWDDKLTFGVAMVGNGGMNTTQASKPESLSTFFTVMVDTIFLWV